MTKSNSSATLSTSNLYEHPWFSQLRLLDNTTTCESPLQLKPKSETTGARCTKCNQWKPFTEFELQPSKQSYRKDCRVCHKEQNRAIRALKKTAPPKPEVCDLCGKPGRFVLDHDHTENKFRGWIHDSCNRGIGFLGDDPDGLIQALTYLSKTISWQPNHVQALEDLTSNLVLNTNTPDKATANVVSHRTGVSSGEGRVSESSH